MFVSFDGKPLKSCQKCRDNELDFDLDECYETHEDFVEGVSSFMEQHDNHKFDAAVQSLRMKVTLTSTFLIENDISVATCAQSGDQELQRRAAMIRNDIPDGARFNLSCSRSIERKTERNPLSIQRYTDMAAKEFFSQHIASFFECHGELHISFSKANESAIIIYEHNGHIEMPELHMTAELMQMADDPQFEKTELHTITRQQIYNVWISITRKESAQLLMGEQDGYRLIEGLQEIGGLLGFTTPCFSDSAKYNREKMTEVFIDSTFGTNKHGYELYCEVGKRGSRFTEWFVALRNAGLHPDVVYTDKDFAGT
ncbi:hypothetical protein POJ06DRAFT_282574 [Lipomyces tetrasporus]|uniref:Uncharacterized protein n=1 Tax=Lipomyces tetrasporus TaxID=54092 RepID=A0AAD7QNQ1_9ASCO|nr:uncharacterized protein POJ06DRAFT_282574 [Lipomyces tetrasporus]KAJ8098596.1 hypothetical protein POJ06DRAFT_282574 [Lipomyces tetrasporus]